MPTDARTANWPGVTDTEALKAEVATDSHRLADAAKVGDWQAVSDTGVVALQGLESPWLAWCRVAGGSGQAHVIIEDRCVLVDEGWV